METIGQSSISALTQHPVQPRNPSKKPHNCRLVVVANRDAFSNARGGIRHSAAFGFKVSPDVDLEMEYELPLWLLMDDEFQKRAAKYYPNHDVLDPHFMVAPQFIDNLRRASTERAAEGGTTADVVGDTPVAQDALSNTKDLSPITPEMSPNTEHALPDPSDVPPSSNDPAPASSAPTKDVSPGHGDHHMEEDSVDSPAVVFGTGRGRGSRPRLAVQPPKKRAKIVPEGQSDIPTDMTSAGVARETSVPPIETIGESISALVQRRPSKPTQPRNHSKKTQSPMSAVVTRRGDPVVSRGGIRHNTAFGFKVPPDVDLELIYELPLWLLMDEAFQKRAAKYHPGHGVLDPDFKLDQQLIDGMRRASTEPAVDGVAKTDVADG
ncbi:hypothetical protein D9758_002210 [Tetrapyrgos nigripes]|uniref:Uncharacterized protein n=1 Tax=Tetrapyrgos nigripes TaxID=182062 RepID=A0A8H5GNZ7_9AGAR|nr:hypothetical protein D9758_002210 [Tetrapyrgos nigripes]